MTLKGLQEREADITRELWALEKEPHLIGYWIDSSKGRQPGQVYTRLVWTVSGRYANGKPRKRRKTLKLEEIGRYRVMIERGVKIQQLRSELEKVKGAIASIEQKISALVG